MKPIVRQIVVIVTFVITLIFNGLAASGALGGTPTGDVSNAYPIYFVPANLTFAIWGVIYTGLAAFAVYQALPSQRENPIVKRISWLFVLTNFVNAIWLVLFQELMFVPSVALMLVLLVILIAIYQMIGRPASRAAYWLIHVPFSIYLAWITIATIANVAQALFANGYENLFGISGEVWAVIMLVVGTGIISAVVLTGRNIAYGLTTIWAVAGIVIAQGPRSTLIGATAMLAIAIIFGLTAYAIWQNRPANRKEAGATLPATAMQA